MATKAEYARIKNSLERERTRLKQEGLQLEKDRLKLSRERTRVVAAVRLLCSQYGNNDWPDEADLDAVLVEHLARPLQHEMIEVRAYVGGLQRRAERAEAELVAVGAAPIVARAEPAPEPAPEQPAPRQRAVRTPVAPTPIRPTALPDPVHRCLTVQSSLRGEPGYRAVCVCGWSSPLVSSEALGLIDGERHCENAEIDHRRARA